MKLDADEKELLDSAERGEWNSATGGKRERARYTLISSLLHKYASGRLREV